MPSAEWLASPNVQSRLGEECGPPSATSITDPYRSIDIEAQERHLELDDLTLGLWGRPASSEVWEWSMHRACNGYLRTAERLDGKVSVMLESVPTDSSFEEQLEQAREWARSPAWMHIDGRPVLALFDRLWTEQDVALEAHPELADEWYLILNAPNTGQRADPRVAAMWYEVPFMTEEGRLGKYSEAVAAGMDLAPVLFAHFDNRAIGGSVVWPDEVGPEAFRRLIEEAMDLDARVLTFVLNEHGERAGFEEVYEVS